MEGGERGEEQTREGMVGVKEGKGGGRGRRKEGGRGEGARDKLSGNRLDELFRVTIR